jgi:CheY-like chemotaxis protein
MRLTSILDKCEVHYRECENSSRAMISYVNNPKFKFDLGLLDIIMPGMTGNELAVKIAASSSPFPLIALSSANQQISGVSPAFSAHINKPYHEEELLEVILSVMRQNDLISSSDDTDSEKILFNINTAPQKIAPFEKEKKDKLKMLSKMKMEPKNKPIDKKYKIDAAKEKAMLSKKVIRKRSAESTLNPNLSILIAEDKERNLDMLIKMLNSLGYTKIDTALNGEEAILAVRNNKGDAFSDKKSNYDVILMDVVMPKKDGIQATKEITAMFSDRRYRPKIIAVTARVTDDADHEYHSCGMDDVIFKPISQISDLAEKLNLVAMTKK